MKYLGLIDYISEEEMTDDYWYKFGLMRLKTFGNPFCPRNI